MRKGFILIISLFILNPAIGQDYYHWISFAEESASEGDVLGAVIYYESAFALDSSKQELQYALAEAYEKAGYYDEAHRLFLKVYSKGRGRFFPDGPAHIAQLKMYKGEYESAIEFWRRALSRTADEKEKEYIKQRLKSCSYALSNPLSDEEIELKPISDLINTVDSEYGIEWSGDSIILFSSLRGSYNDNWELDSAEHYYSRIYISRADNYGFSEPIELDITGLLPSQHILHPTLSSNSDKLFFTICDDENICAIAMAEKSDGLFELKSKLDEEYLDDSSNSQPFLITVDSIDYLIFSSTRKGGYGGYDLWLAELDEDRLINMRNLGPSINTSGNEVTAYYNLDSEVLYFSSDLHPGYGGYDVFSIDYDLINGTSGQLKNSGIPINSSVNDIFYREAIGSSYLTSNRPGSLSSNAKYCCTDIYVISPSHTDTAFVINDGVVPQSIESVDELKGLLPISLYFHNDIPDPGSQSNTTEINYEETVDGYLSLRPTYISEYSLNQDDSIGNEARIRMDSFFDKRISSEYEKLEGVAGLLLRELDKGQRIEIAIKGYASPLAKSDYNRKLTQRRIASIINYLRELDSGALRKYMNGESPELKIRTIPYGEEESEEFVSDNPQDAKNSIYSIAAMRERRVEILRIEEQD